MISELTLENILRTQPCTIHFSFCSCFTFFELIVHVVTANYTSLNFKPGNPIVLRCLWNALPYCQITSLQYSLNLFGIEVFAISPPETVFAVNSTFEP